MFPKYRYRRDRLTTGFESQVSADYLELVADAVFENWSKRLEKVPSQSQQKELKAELYPRSEGRSGTPVLELSYLDQDVCVSRFIARLHAGSDSRAAAQRERDVVQHIQSASQATDYFSGDLILLESFPEAVIYRHAADQFGEPCLPLNLKLTSIIKGGDERDAHSLGDEISRLLRAVNEAYGSIRASRLTAPINHFRAMETRLCPDIIINASDRFTKFDGSRLTISTADGDQPSQDRFISDYTDEFLLAALERGDELTSGWLRLRTQRVNGDRPPYFAFRFGSLSVWMRLDSAGAIDGVREIILKLDSQLISPITTAMEDLKIPRDAFLTPDEYKKLWEFIKDPVQVGPRHTDLHLQNILCATSGSRLKVVDLASADDDLLMVGPARLETSLIFEVSPDLRLDAEEADVLINWIENSAKTPEPALSPEGKKLGHILQKIRAAVSDTPDAMALAYGAQAMIHYRYALERNLRPGPLFIAFARHWLLRFQKIVFGDAMASLENSSSTEPAFQPSSPVSGADWPKLIDLWELALRSHVTGLPQERGRRFLEGLYQGKPDLLNSPLTSIQRHLWEAAVSPFQSDLNVIISAPTASGKSTVAEMFLVAPAILNNDRRCAIYIAPTRALTQAKHRDLIDRFSSLPLVRDNIVLSTGEDDDHDWRIRHGNFSVACMVYEKANILFSTNPGLLDVLSCLVIDEFHMLSNLERGPILEIALTKILAERRRIDALSNRGPRREALRLVAITTEENPDQSIRDLLSVRDTTTGDRRSPLVFFDSERPVKVEHCLVLRGNEGHGSSLVFPFLEFSGSERRTLPVEEIVRIDSALDGIRESPPDADVPPTSVDKELKARLDMFLADLLTTYPRGYRALIFVPGRRDAEEGASRLKNTLRRRFNVDSLQQAATRYKHEEVLKRLRPHLDGAEDKRMADLLRKCAAAGIFIHHSDVDKRVRLEIENICSRLDPDAAAQVIFATETLSYGVNLAISDVVIVGTQFITQTRFRVRRVAPLSTCEFHNMMGRTGRLGRTGKGKSRAYIFVPSGEDPTAVVTDYYTAIEGAESRLYVKDDRAVQLRAEENPFLAYQVQDPLDECSVYQSLGVLDFSYPFVRSVLDALRHLNSSSSERGDTKTPIRFDLLLELLGSTLYSFQFLKGGVRREAKLFRCAVQRILDDCSREDLHLVESSKGEVGAETYYRITARGEAIIDTGTEVHTVEPLLRMVSSIQDIWNRQGFAGAFTPDLQVLCILAQTEVFRQVISYAPECRPYRYWPQSLVEENRQVVLAKLESTLTKVAATLSEEDVCALAVAIRELLDKWEPLRKVNAGYPGGATDSLLRLYCGIVLWITLEERATVDSVIEGHDLREGFQGRMLGFRQFTDLLSWKTLFLAKILVTDKAPRIPFGADDERSLHLLASRLRLGCTAQAIPLFWPFSSDFRRPEAARLLSADATPKRILAIGELSVLSENSGDIMPGKLEKLRQDLERYAKSEFNELAAELTAARDPDDAKREAVNKLWEEMRDVFSESIASFRSARFQESASTGLDDILRTALSFESLGLTKEGRVKPYLTAAGRGAKDERYRIRIEVPSAERGLVLHGEQEVDLNEEERPAGSRRGVQRQRQHSVRLMGVQFRSNWECSLQKDHWISFKKLLLDAEPIPHLVILASPWTPLPEEMSKEVGHMLMHRARDLGCTTIFMTPAGLLLLLSSVVRGFIGSQTCMRLLMQYANSVGNPYASLCVSDVLQAIDSASDRQVPPSIREKMLRHFEV